MNEVPEAIYQRPTDYDLEHVGDTQDIAFFTQTCDALAAETGFGTGVRQRACHAAFSASGRGAWF